MADPYRIEAECANCGKKYKLDIEDTEDFLKDSIAGVVDGVNQLLKRNTHEAADKVEERMQKHHNLNLGDDGKLYCDNCI